MTKVAVVSTIDHIYGVNKSLELLGINPVKDKNVVFKPNFNTADPFPASSSMETVKQIILKLKEMGAKSITVAERSGPAKTAVTFEKKGLYDLGKALDFKIVDLRGKKERIKDIGNINLGDIDPYEFQLDAAKSRNPGLRRWCALPGRGGWAGRSKRYQSLQF